MTKTRPADIYLRFLQLTEALRGLPSLPELDPLEERILALIARAGQTDERLSVRDVMGVQDLGAPATVHNRLKSMRLRRVSSVSTSMIQPFWRIDFRRLCTVAGAPSSWLPITSRTDRRSSVWPARATRARMRSSSGSSAGSEGKPRKASLNCRKRR